MWLFATTVFLSAFLLFQVQPLLAKAILPWFGGTPAVWTTCMLFFQVMLLAGYAYAYWVQRQPRQKWIHLGLLAVSLLFLRILPAASWRPLGDENPALRILLLLAATISVPYVALAATGPLLQAWFRDRYPGRSPYRLYALSNTGSLLALLSYPFGFEPWLPLPAQALGWSALFIVFAVACAFCARQAVVPATAAAPTDTGRTSLGWGERFFWVALPAGGSALLLATTNELSQDVSVVPFLWVLPLSLYLLTFILCFDSDRWYRRGVWLPLWPLAAAGVCCALFRGVELGLGWQVAAHAAGLFVGGMVCHGELVRRRPAAGQLTGFYLHVAAGGALGGVAVSLAAPWVLPDFWEYHLVWVATGVLVIAALVRDPGSWLYAWRPRWTLAGLASVLSALAAALLWQARERGEWHVDRTRNFYGVLHIERGRFGNDPWDSLRLQHGRIAHGLQFTEGEYCGLPVSYYAPDTGVGVALRALPERGPRHIGVVGLGAGIMAAWGRSNDVVRFYEINPGVVRMCDKHFTYRRKALARIELALGDARLNLERELHSKPLMPLDVLVLDAFSSDSIPLHLLTREAFAVYAQRLRPGGVLAVHISNRFLRLEGLVRGLANAIGWTPVLVSNEVRDEDGTMASSWVLVTNDAEFLATKLVSSRQANWAPEDIPLVFTDSYSNLYRLLK